ncbi:MAG: TRAP transporter large permease subunit [Burkholderiales bacterium]|nr:TRAP transporter large permease subunit [Burkholderiales bacterium]MCC7115102.1 TRAP transporter large permease subunit [Burkholderiales bacterium]
MTIAIFLGSLLGAMAIGMPIAFALILCGIALMIHLDNFDAQIIATNIINGADSFPLMAVPFFMLAGEIMNAGGLSRRIVAFAMALVGHVRGGLGYVTVVAGCLLATVSGSAVADAAALSSLLVPMMVAAGHDRNRSGGLVAASGIIGPIIPPSIAFVLFGVAGGLSITKLFLAGIVPGLMLGAALVLAWWWMMRGESVVVQPRRSGRDVVRALIDGFWALMLPVIIIVGLKFGVFTPTEAAVVAAVYALLIATFVYREISPRGLYDVFLSAARTTGVIMFLVAASLVSAWLITVAELPAKLVELLSPFIDRPILLMALMMLAVLVIGGPMDMAPTILILTPILLPVVKEAGIDPIYFGVLFVINNAIGLITPPVGTVLNVVCGVSKISMDDLLKGVMPFLLAEIAVLCLLILFPPLVTVPLGWFLG